MMIGFCPLASGSKGNSVFVASRKTRVLIDAGLSYRQLTLRLDEIGVKPEQIDAVLITHDHTDHIRGIELLAARHHIPVFANSDTARGILDTLESTPRFKIFSTGEPFSFGDLAIHPFSIQHDTLDPVAFVIELEGVKCGFCTDLGFVSSHVIENLKGCHHLYLEANHEPSMVHSSPRHYRYKERVLSRQGHLSNSECADLLEAIYHPELKTVHLAHLSSECNSEERALKTVKERLLGLGASTEVFIAHQDRVSTPVGFQVEAEV